MVTGLLLQGEDRDAAGALLDLLALCLEHRWQRAFGMTLVRVALEALCESPRLDRRGRAVIELVAYTLFDPDRRRAAEVILSASRYLADSRHRPELAFRPTHPRVALAHFAWDELESWVRCNICIDVGIAEETGRLQARDLDSGLQDRIAWRFEVLRRVRIEFAPRRPRQPPAG